MLAVCPLALRNYGLWPLAPAIMAAVAATYLDRRPRWWLIVGATVLSALPGGAVSLVSGDGELAYAALFPPGMTAFILWSILGPLWAWDIARRLDEARRLSAELAVKDERLRFAADLHDIQGHHLQVIALKSELAARLAEADPARAGAEMKEVQRLAIAASALTEDDCPLTERELEVLRAARTGASVNEIAAQVHLAPGTVRNYLSAA